MNFEGLREFGQAVYFGNSLGDWARALLTFVLWLTVVPLARAFIGRFEVPRGAACLAHGFHHLPRFGYGNPRVVFALHHEERALDFLRPRRG